MGEVPARTREQRERALRGANQIRFSRSHMKRALKLSGRELLISLILQTQDGRVYVPDAPEGFLDNMKVQDLIMATRGFHRSKTDRCLRRAEVSPNRTLAGLTARQRQDLVRLIRTGGGG